MAESNPSPTGSLNDVLDTFPSDQPQIASNVPKCSFTESHDHLNENCGGPHFVSSLQAALRGLEFLNSVASSDPVPDVKFDSTVDVSYCVQKNLKGPEAAEFLKNFRRPTPAFNFPMREQPRRQRAQYKWLVFISHIFIYSTSRFRFTEHPFLGYSFIQNGIYCVPCALMGSTRNMRNQAVSIFITEPFFRYRNFRERAICHAASELHRKNFQMVTKLYGKNWMAAESESIKDDDTPSNGDANIEVLETKYDSDQLS